MYKTTNPTVYLETGKLQQSTASGENGGVDSKQVKSSCAKSKSDIFLQKLRFDFWENGQGGLQSWSFCQLPQASCPPCSPHLVFLLFLLVVLPFALPLTKAPGTLRSDTPFSHHTLSHCLLIYIMQLISENVFAILCQFPITVTIYLVKKTSSDKT